MNMSGSERNAKVIGLLVQCPDCGSEVPMVVSPFGCGISGGNFRSELCPKCKLRLTAGWTSSGLPFAYGPVGPRDTNVPGVPG